MTIPSNSVQSDGRLAKTIGKSTLFGVVASGAQVGTRLVTVPIVIHHLGLSGYGIWSIIIVTAAYMRFGSAGIKSAFQKYVAESTATGKYDVASILLSTGSMGMLVLSLLGLIPVGLFSTRVAVASGVPPEFISAAATSIAMLACIYVFSNFGAAFEAIVMGGHRVDLTRKYATVLTVCEAALIIGLLNLGYGLIGMTAVMAISEVLYILFCYMASRRVVPQITISWRYFRRDAFRELIRFAGSYQLVNVLELLYGAILPIAILKYFGAEAAGVFALASRVISSALIAQDALVLPLLSGGTMVFASGSAEQTRTFLAKAFKVTFASAFLPLSFVSVFGASMVFAWTGEKDPRLQTALWLTALAALFKAISLIQLVLYRASGRALLDNIRQALRIVAIVLVAGLGASLGFRGVLAGMAAAELIGVVFMFAAMSATFQGFNVRLFTSDSIRICIATLMIVVTGAIVGMVPIPINISERWMTVVRLGEICAGCVVAAWPALTITGAISGEERRTMFNLIARRQHALPAGN